MEGSQAEVLVSANNELAAKLLKIAESCKNDIDTNGAMKFIEVSGNRQVGFVQATMPTVVGYCEWLKTVGVETRAQMEEVWERYLDNKAVCESIETLKKAESAFDAVSAGVNKILQEDEDAKVVSVKTCAKGDIIPKTLQLTDLSTGGQVDLGSILNETGFTLFVLNRHFA